MKRRSFGRWMATAMAAALLSAAAAQAQDPLEISTASLPLGAVGTPYSATLSASGGTPPYAWRLSSDAPPSATETSPGTFEFDGESPDSGWVRPDHNWELGGFDVPLPFPFPFFGTVCTNVRANPYGTLTFTDLAPSEQLFDGNVFDSAPMIAVLWPEINNGEPFSYQPFDCGPGELWLKSSADEVTILWRDSWQSFYTDEYTEWGSYQTETLNLSCSATLRPDGTIVLKYPSSNECYIPGREPSGIAGLSAGDGTTVVYGSVAPGTDTVYTPAPLPAGLAFTSDGFLSGTPEATGESSLVARVADAAGATASRTLVLGVAGDGMAWDEQGKWTYTVDGGVATVTSGPSTGDISVPAAFAGIPVGAIGPSAFARCTALTSIAFPPTVTSIGDSAFFGCIALTNAPLPAALAALGTRAFQGCSSLAAIDLPDALAAIPPYAFASCAALASVSFGDHVTSIGNYAFNQCRALPSLDLPGTLQSIGEYAFEYCSGIAAVDFPASLGTIGQYAFHASGLRELFVPATVTNLASRSFWESRSLTNVVFGTGTKSVPWGIFDYCTALSSVTLPEGLSSVGSIAFRGCTSLVSVDFPSTLATIGERAFDECKGLSSVTLPDSVSSVGNYAFRKCSALTNAVVGTGVSALPTGLFESCSSLASVTLSPGLSSIGSTAFYLCTSLAVPPALDGVVSIGAGAFSYCAFADVALPSSVTNLGTEVFRACASLTNAVLPSGLAAVPVSTFDKCTALVSVTLPSSATAVGNYAFRDCTALASVDLPPTLASIGMYAFKNCSALAEIALPASLSAVASDAFAACTSLTAVHTPSLEAWLSIAFANAPANPLTYAHRLVVGGTDLADLALPASVAAIPAYAFSGASGLVSVAFGGAASIGAGAFTGCTSLPEVSIPDSVATVGASAFSGCSALGRAEVPAAWWGTALVATAGFPEACTVVYRGLAPLVMLTTNLPPAVAGTPYAATLAATGGTTPYAWTLAVPALYTESRSEGSTYADPDGETEPTAETDWSYDASCHVELPFAFPFFGRLCTNLYVNPRGILSFDLATDYWGEIPSISAFDAECWTFDNWYGTIRVYVSPDEVTAYWQGTWGGSWEWTPEWTSEQAVNVAVTLRPDGSITMKYGQTDLSYASIGLCDGNETWIWTSREDISWPSWMDDVVFTLPPWPAGLSWTPDGLLQGIPAAPGAYEIVATVADASGVALTNVFPFLVADPSAVTTNSPVPVPHDWLLQNAAAILDECGGDFEAAAVADAPVGRPVWECWLAGIGTAAGSPDFTVSLDFDETGAFTLSWRPDLNEGLEVPVRTYRILAKQSLDDPSPWTDVTDLPDLSATPWRHFCITVSLP